MKRRGTYYGASTIVKARTQRPRRYARRVYSKPRIYKNRFTNAYIPELKFQDFQANQTAFSTSWITMEDATADCISAVAQGDGPQDRDGRVYYIESIHMKGVFLTQAEESVVTPIPDMRGRFLIVLDKQTNQTQIVPAEVMDEGQTDDTLAFRNLSFTQHHQVLWDKTITLRRPNTNEGAINLFAVATNSTVMFSYNRRFNPPLRVTTNNTTAVVGSIMDNSLHVIGIGTDTRLLLNYQTRMRFRG